MLGRQNAVNAFERKLAVITKKVGQVRLPKPGLARQQGDAHGAPLDPAQHFKPESLVHLRKVHLWKIRHQQWERRICVCSWKSYSA
ncbi:MAG: hypothetical protein ABR987_19960 [Terracidiphilus sp.]